MRSIGNGKKYRVPSFQRDYAWEEEQWEDLWNDIQELLHAPDTKHYMGALVVKSLSERDFEIIDGQQRIATLSVLVLSVIHCLLNLPGDEATRNANAERAMGLRQDFIGKKDTASLLHSSKLFLNATNDGFYQDYLVQLRKPSNPRGLSKSNQLLWQCFNWFCKRLTASGLVGESLARLVSDTLAWQLQFIRIDQDLGRRAGPLFLVWPRHGGPHLVGHHGPQGFRVVLLRLRVGRVNLLRRPACLQQGSLCARPGGPGPAQLVMCWGPRLHEKPHRIGADKHHRQALGHLRPGCLHTRNVGQRGDRSPARCRPRARTS